MNVHLALTNTGPEGYKVHFSTSRPSRNRSSDVERDRLGPDQLTKSRYMTGVTENKRQMWFETRGQLSPDIGERWRMEQGNLVSELAREEFPDGTFVGGPPSEAELQPTRPLFKVRFSVDDMTVRGDVLRPAPSGGWVLIRPVMLRFSVRAGREGIQAE